MFDSVSEGQQWYYRQIRWYQSTFNISFTSQQKIKVEKPYIPCRFVTPVFYCDKYYSGFRKLPLQYRCWNTHVPHNEVRFISSEVVLSPRVLWQCPRFRPVSLRRVILPVTPPLREFPPKKHCVCMYFDFPSGGRIVSANTKHVLKRQPVYFWQVVFFFLKTSYLAFGSFFAIPLINTLSCI